MAAESEVKIFDVNEHELARQRAREKEARDQRIKDYLASVCIVENSCEAIQKYLQFEDNLDPQIRALLIVNSMFLTLSAVKVFAKSALDLQIQGISDPDARLGDIHMNLQSKIDTASETAEKSLKDVLNVLQSQLFAALKK